MGLDRVSNVPAVPGVEYQHAQRQGCGSMGKAIMLKSNLFKINIPKDDLHQYKVEIKPNNCPRFVDFLIRSTSITTSKLNGLLMLIK